MGGTPGNEGFLPAIIIVAGDVSIGGEIDISGSDGVAAAGTAAGDGGDDRL